MMTCGYCGSILERKYCHFCEMELLQENIQKNRKRKNHMIQSQPDPFDFLKSTREILNYKTIELLYLLQEARKHRSEIYKFRILGHKAFDQSNDEEMEENQRRFFEEYEYSTRKVWVIENILKDRIGYYPKKLTNNFLSLYAQRIKSSQDKDMVIKKSVR